MVSALWAYDGWNNVSMVSSEIRDPQRNLPRALIFGTLAGNRNLPALNVAYFYVLTPSQVGLSRHVAADMMDSVGGRLADGGCDRCRAASQFWRRSTVRFSPAPGYLTPWHAMDSSSGRPP